MYYYISTELLYNVYNFVQRTRIYEMRAHAYFVSHLSAHIPHSTYISRILGLHTSQVHFDDFPQPEFESAAQ